MYTVYVNEWNLVQISGLTYVTMKNTVFWDVMTCSPADIY
jgi:hypothetical protein